MMLKEQINLDSTQQIERTKELAKGYDELKEDFKRMYGGSDYIRLAIYLYMNCRIAEL